MAYKSIELSSFLKDLDEQFLKNPNLWYEHILPKEKADEFKRKHKKISVIWHVHCSECWDSIDMNSRICYYDEETSGWLCKECFDKLNKNALLLME